MSCIFPLCCATLSPSLVSSLCIYADLFILHTSLLSLTASLSRLSNGAEEADRLKTRLHVRRCVILLCLRFVVHTKGIHNVWQTGARGSEPSINTPEKEPCELGRSAFSYTVSGVASCSVVHSSVLLHALYSLPLLFTAYLSI